MKTPAGLPHSAERIRAIEELLADLKKTPEDRVLEKLDEILKAIQALPHYYPPYIVYPYQPQPAWIWTSPTVTTSGPVSTGGSWSQQATSGLVVTNGSSAMEA